MENELYPGVVGGAENINDWEISHFHTCIPLPIHLGRFPQLVFFSAALGDSSQEATRRHCSGSTEFPFLSAWLARNQNPIFQTESSSWARSIHLPTTTLTTTDYVQKPAYTRSALLHWCFPFETLLHITLRHS